MRTAKESAAAAKGKVRVRVLGTTKLVALLLSSRPPLASDDAGAGTEEEAPTAIDGDTAGVSCAVFDSFEAHDGALRTYARSLRKRRGHDAGRRRRRPDGFSAPFAEKTWHRVVLAEHLRLLLERPVCVYM